MARRLAAILAADVVGYSRMMGADESGTLGSLKSHRAEVIDPRAAQYGGRIIKLMGDGVLMEFASVVDAVAFAVEMQLDTAAWNAGREESGRLQFRIGVNIGDVMIDGDDLYGDGVNVAARLEGLAQPGGICVRRNVRNQIRDKLDLSFEDLGEIEVKNIARPVRAFHLRMDEKAAALATSPTPRRDAPRSRRLGLVAAALAILLLGGAVLILQSWAPEPGSEGHATAPPDRPSIAVLPFANVSEDRAQEYFADGLTDDLITDLSKVSGLFVIARNSAFTYKGEAVRVERVAEELGVRYVVEGSVRRSGDRLRVNAQLIDGTTGRHLWAERYDRGASDVFAVQDDLVAQIVSALAVALTQGEEIQLAHRQAPEFAAYDLYLKAREGYFSRDQARMRESLTLFTQAWEIDPDFARAYSGYARLAADIWRRSALRGVVSAALRESATLAARKALRLDPTLADAHSVLALMSMVEKDHETAVEQARRAVELDPNSADAHTTLAIVLCYAGRPADALASIEASLRLNPRPTPHHRVYQGLALFLNGRFADAIAVLEPVAGTRDRGLGDSPREILAMAYARAGEAEKARAQIDALHLEEPFLNVAYYRVVYDHHARREDLELRLDALAEAGLPRWPLGFDAGEARPLSGDEVAVLVAERTWLGEDAGRDTPFFLELGEGGSAVYATDSALLNGSVQIRGNQLCEQYDGFVLDRDLCGPVFDGREVGAFGDHPYAYVNPSTVRYFSTE